MNRHLAHVKLIMEISCFSVIAPALLYYSPSMDFSVVKLRNSPAQYSAMARIPRLESGYFNHNLLDPYLIRGSPVKSAVDKQIF